MTEHFRKERRAFGWHPETFVCARRGHVTPAAFVAEVRPEDAGLGVEAPGDRRFARCLRCDVWLEVPRPEQPGSRHLPALEDLRIPRRGEALREAIIIRLIAIDRAIHSVVFALLTAGLLALVLDLGPLRDSAARLVKGVGGTISNTGQGPSQDLLTRALERIATLKGHSLDVLLVTSAAYCVVEGVEAVGLWHERRWAEYLTAVATAGFLPFEVHELIARVTVVRVVALVLNLAILVWLIAKKKLFGVGGGARALRHEELDRRAVFGPPAPV